MFLLYSPLLIYQHFPIYAKSCHGKSAVRNAIARFQIYRNLPDVRENYHQKPHNSRSSGRYLSPKRSEFGVVLPAIDHNTRSITVKGSQFTFIYSSLLIDQFFSKSRSGSKVIVHRRRDCYKVTV
jgi:hypothetical protein